MSFLASTPASPPDTSDGGISEGKRKRLLGSWMLCLSLCAHFVGYELVRAASVALLTGLGDSNALGYTITAGFPLSAFALYIVHHMSRVFGVRDTLRLTQGFIVVIFAIVTYVCPTLSNSKSTWSKVIIICFYCFREIYVGVIATQNWSFVKIPYDLLVKFSGLVSVASVIGSICVEFLVNAGGVRVLLAVAIAIQVVSSAFSEVYFLLDKENESDDPNSEALRKSKLGKSFYVQSADLMSQNITLRLLLLEAVLHQGCSNLINQLFYDGLRRHIDSDTGRAVLIGRFFAVINLISCLMQCLVVPAVMTPRRMPSFLLSVPVLVLLGVSFAFAADESLMSVMLGFAVLKVLEYSVMTSAMEMIYMPMGHEVRYLGKELIRFFGHRLGKSGTSLLLSAANSYIKPSIYTQTLWTSTLSALWGASMYLLSLNLEADVVGLLEKKIRARSLGIDPIATIPNLSSNGSVTRRERCKSEAQAANVSMAAAATAAAAAAASSPASQFVTTSAARPRSATSTSQSGKTGFVAVTSPPTLDQWLSNATCGKRQEKVTRSGNNIAEGSSRTSPVSEKTVNHQAIDKHDVSNEECKEEESDANMWGELRPEIEFEEDFSDGNLESESADLSPYVMVRTNSTGETWLLKESHQLQSPKRASPQVR